SLQTLAHPPTAQPEKKKKILRGFSAESYLIFLSHRACRPAARRVRQRVESIYSRRSEEPKAACQRKPKAPLALSSTERLHKKPFACLPTTLRPSGQVQQWIFHQAEKGIDTSRGAEI